MVQILISGDFGEALMAKAISQLGLNYSIKIQHYQNLINLDKYKYLVLDQIYGLNFNERNTILSLIQNMNQIEECVLFNGDLFPRIKSHIEIKKGVHVPAIAYGLSPRCDIRALNLLTTSTSTSFDLYIYHELFGHFETKAIGMDSLYALLVAITIGYQEGLSAIEIQEKIINYQGNIEIVDSNTYMHIELESLKQLECALETLHTLSPYKMNIVVVPDAFPIESTLPYMKYVSKIYDASNFPNYKNDLNDCHILMIDSSLLI